MLCNLSCGLNIFLSQVKILQPQCVDTLLGWPGYHLNIILGKKLVDLTVACKVLWPCQMVCFTLAEISVFDEGPGRPLHFVAVFLECSPQVLYFIIHNELQMVLAQTITVNRMSLLL
jgi:hypothetical protein